MEAEKILWNTSVSFVPFAFESYGVLDQEAYDFLSKMASNRLSPSLHPFGEDYDFQRLVAAIAVKIQEGNYEMYCHGSPIDNRTGGT